MRTRSIMGLRRIGRADFTRPLHFEVRILDDWIDDDGSALWILATTLSGLNQSAFFHSVRAIAEPLGGDVVEAGLAPDDLEEWIASKS